MFRLGFLIALAACSLGCSSSHRPGSDATAPAHDPELCSLPSSISLEAFCTHPRWAGLCEGDESFDAALQRRLAACTADSSALPVKIGMCNGFRVLDTSLGGLGGIVYYFDPDHGQLVGVTAFSDTIEHCPEGSAREVEGVTFAGSTPGNEILCENTCRVCGIALDNRPACESPEFDHLRSACLEGHGRFARCPDCACAACYPETIGLYASSRTAFERCSRQRCKDCEQTEDSDLDAGP